MSGPGVPPIIDLDHSPEADEVSSANPELQRLITDIPTEDVGRRGSRGAVVSLGARVGGLFLTLGSQAALGRLVPAAEYGVYAMGLTALNLLLVFREFGLQAAGVQKDTLSLEEASFLFWANLAMIGGLGLIGCLAAPAIAAFYGNVGVAPVLVAMSLGAVMGGVSAQHAMLLRRQLRFTTLAVVDTLALVCGIVAGVTVAFLRRDVWALLTLLLVQQGMTSVLTFAFSRWVPGVLRYRKEYLAMIRFGAAVTAANLLYYVTNNISAIIIGKRLGGVPLGHFNRAQQIYSIPANVMFSSIYAVVFSSLSRLMSSPEDYRGFYTAALRRVSLFYMSLSGLLVVAGDDVIAVLLGPRWGIAGHALQLLGLGLVGSGMAQMTGMLLQTQGRLKALQLWSIIDCVVRVSMLLVGSIWGVFGIATAFALSTTLLTAPASLWFVGRSGPVNLRHQVAAVTPSLLIFFMVAIGAFGGRLLMGDHQPGLLSLMVKLGCAGVLSLVLGLLLTPTRRLLLEVFGDVKNLASKRGGGVLGAA